MNEMSSREWNDTYPVGQPIALTEDDGSLTYTQTRSAAWKLGDGVIVVLVSGKSGGYALNRIKAR